jgi:hypothetical protein
MRIARWDQRHTVGPGQPEFWTVIDFEAAEDVADRGCGGAGRRARGRGRLVLGLHGRPGLLTQPIGCHRVATDQLLLVGG